ncbi:MAG: plastocyanin/azurin family copper-binding protein [Gemmatimonadales bacterium]
MRVSKFVTIGIVAAAISCGGSNSSPTGTVNDPPPPTGGVNITVQNFSFSPAVDTIKVGTTVQWVNNGPSEHSSTSDTGLWNSQGLTPPSGGGAYGGATAGATFQFTFNQAGTFTYHCMFHPPSAYPSFVGTIVVTN